MFKVTGRLIPIVTEDPDEPIITVKVESEHAETLVGEHGSIEPGPIPEQAPLDLRGSRAGSQVA